VGGVVRAPVVGVVHIRGVGVVAGGGADGPVHAPLAGPAPDHAAQQVGPPRLRVRGQGGAVAAGAVGLAHHLRRVPHGPADDGRVRLVWGPDPLLGGTRRPRRPPVVRRRPNTMYPVYLGFSRIE
jgi:hypothetical protein